MIPNIMYACPLTFVFRAALGSRGADQMPAMFGQAALADAVKSIALADDGAGVSSDDVFEINTVFMFVCTALVMLMTPGLAFFYAGLHKPSSVCAMMAMSFACMGIVTLLWFFGVFGMAFGAPLDPYNP